MKALAFTQLDVFGATPMRGNPLAVVHGGDALSQTQMAAFARWTNLSETCFLLEPTDAAADYRVRIFTPGGELPFAGHPTLGACHAWLEAGGVPRGEERPQAAALRQPPPEGVKETWGCGLTFDRPEDGRTPAEDQQPPVAGGPAFPCEVVQQCGIGLVRLRRGDQRLAFAAPPLLRSGAVEPEVLAQIVRCLRIEPAAICASQWVDNGPHWVAVMLGSREEVLALQPDFAAMGELELGVIAPCVGGDAQFEVRAFVPTLGVPEDPVTGSLNAGLAQWLIGAGLAPPRYVASQGTALGRAGRLYVERSGADIWIGGATVSCIRGKVWL